ncbi:response regulator [Flavivirga eckloniae]|uniref:DNA-binding response regulator n=1 Tax=Flavivirga eckloniae TaxID=1803846 RepID=A0A2K9PN18_9FLAO|nr:response regulator [Flavivirga eckloniae]AUP78452.1 DNA-binding response regulator [Flavivirga eckloniae]
MNPISINLLIIEDSAIIANAYKNILKEISNVSFNVTFAKDCDEAVQKIQRIKAQLILLDLQLPISKNERFICGEDLGLLIRKVMPNAKILILTSVTDQARVQSIINEIRPEGFMIKSDIDGVELKNAILQTLKGKIYYSKTIEGYTRKTYANRVVIDDFDRQILYHLSMGEKTKDLSNYIPLSTRAIEVRKTKLKNLLDTKNNKNFNLVKEAKKLGFI